MTIDFIDVQAPEPGEWQQVSPGILWLRMPLPFELDHINLYLIEDNDRTTGEKGFALIDTGFGVSKTEELWDSLLSKLDVPLTKVIVTHMHPDHIGMAAAFTMALPTGRELPGDGRFYLCPQSLFSS